MLKHWKPLFIVAWLMAAVYLLLSVVTGNDFNIHKPSFGFNYGFDRVGGTILVEAVESHGAAMRAGLQVGDRLDGPSTQALLLAEAQAPKPLAINVHREGVQLSMRLEPEVVLKKTFNYAFRLYVVLLGFLCLVASGLIGLARTTHPSFRWLAAMLLVWASGLVARLVTHIEWYAISGGLSAAANVLAPLAMIRFWLDFCEEEHVSIGAGWHLWNRVLIAVGAVFLLFTAFDIALLLSMANASHHAIARSIHRVFLADQLGPLSWIASGALMFGTCVALPIRVMRHSRGATSNVAFWTSLSLLGFFLPPAGYFFGKAVLPILGASREISESFEELWVYATMPVAILCLFSFVVLSFRRRMMSFEFAINRTVVYAFTGGFLVAGFWLLKNNIESSGFVQEDTQQVLLSASVAGLGFVAKHLKGAAEKWLKRLVFVEFNRREVALEAFKAKLPHFTTLEALNMGAIEALSNFCHRTRLEVFAWERGQYVGRSTRRTVDPDGDIPVSLRSSRAPMGSEGLTHPQAEDFRLAVPAFQGPDLEFFVLIYDALDLPVFRPDEIALIKGFVAAWSIERSALELRRMRDVVTNMAQA